MSYYFNKAYNWYWDIHPYRPTIEDYRKKNMVIKQIKDMKQFKFRNRTYPLPLPERQGKVEIDYKENIQLTKGLTKEEINMMFNKIKSINKKKST